MKNCTLKKYDGNADVYFDIICKWMDVMYDENNKEKIKNILIDEFNIVEEDSEIISNALLTSKGCNNLNFLVSTILINCVIISELLDCASIP